VSINANGAAGRPQRVSFNLAGGGTDLQAQCETLVTRSNGATAADFTDASLSGGRGNSLNATTAVGNPYVEYDVTLPSSGTWNIKVAVKKHPSYGIFQASIPQASADLSVPKNLYAASLSYSTIDLGNYTFGSAGTKTFRFRVTGKNALSANYYLAFDYLKLTKQ